MKKSMLDKLLGRVALSALLIGSVASAQAAVYTGSWDPAYGAPFTVSDGFGFDLGWRGAASFEVPGACTPGTTGVQVVGASSCGASTLSAFVQFYDLVDPVVTLEQLDWGGTSSSNVGALANLLYNNGQLIGFSTSAFDYITDTNEYVEPGGSGPLAWSLGFSFNTGITTGANGPTLTWGDFCDGLCSTGTNDPRIPIDFVVTQIPEPGSLALVTAALAGVGWASRRRRRPRAAGNTSRARAPWSVV